MFLSFSWPRYKFEQNQQSDNLYRQTKISLRFVDNPAIKLP